MKDESPDAETEYHARFYFNRGTLRMGVGDILDVFTGFDDSNSVFTVQVQKDLTSFQLRIGARNDLGTWTYNPTWTTISNDWNSIEVEYLRGTNSGEMRLWVNGVLAQTLTVLDTDTIAIDAVQLGVMGVDSGTRGTLYLDDFTSTRFSAIGMLPDPGVHEELPVVHTYTSQPDGTAGVDTFINSSGSTSNYGTIDYMWVGYSSDTNGKYRSLIKFNLASIPANATITSATLILRLNYQGGTTANTMSVYPLLKNWTETGVTWNRYDGTNNWQTAGAGGATDRDTTSMGSRSFVSSEPVGFKVIPLDVSTMQNYVNGTRANYGWLLKMDTESGFLYEFTTSDRYIAANRPQLVVEYTLPEEEPDWVNKAYTYEDADHIHAVTSLVVTDENDNQTTNTYRYDANGNMTCRIEGGETFLQVYNAENHMSGVLLVTGDCDTLGDTLKAWEFTYDGDGVKVKQEYTDTNGTLTTYYYMGGSYEVQTDGTTETERQYYAIAGVTAGMREGSTFYYFLTDHLGSIVGVTDTTGTLISETRYLPFGEIRTDVGTVSQTDYGYTFQRNVSDMGLMDYKARYYSNLLGRFVQPDSIIPGAGSPQAWNRFSYSNNNPINFNDPSGHYACKDFDENGKCVLDDDWVKISIYNSSNTKKITQILTNSFSLQAIKIIDSEESYSDFSGSGDPNTLIRPEWDNQKPKNSQNSPDAALSAIYDTTESGANASYVLFPNGNQVVTSYVQSFRSNRLAFVPSPKLIDVTITNNSQSLINYKLTINAENIALSSIVTASPGESVSFNIQPINIPINGLNISVSASSSCMSPCITRKDPILFRGWIQFFIP